MAKDKSNGYATVGEAIKDLAIGSCIAPRSQSKGIIKVVSGIKVDGRHVGDIICDGSEKSVVWVSASGVVNGSICASKVYVEGVVTGKIYADEIHGLGKASLHCDLFCVHHKIGKGVSFEGRTTSFSAAGEFKNHIQGI